MKPMTRSVAAVAATLAAVVAVHAAASTAQAYDRGDTDPPMVTETHKMD